MKFSVRCHSEILVPWQRDVTTSPLTLKEVITTLTLLALRDDTNNGCVADYPFPRVSCVLNPPHYTQFTREKRVNTRVKKYTQKVVPKSKILSDVFVRS